jgi:phosphoenolpyruvate carboxykinase (GTP)
VPAGQCPVIAPEWEDPKGVPISAILFGGRRASAVPLVTRRSTGATACSWRPTSPRRARGGGERHRRDPARSLRHAAVLRLQHGRLLQALAVAGREGGRAKLPRIYFVNWFRKDKRGKFVWPGFGDNSRVLKWIVERLDGKAAATDTPIGRVPTRESLDLSGLSLTDEQLDTLLTVDPVVWAEEAGLIADDYLRYGDRLPAALLEEHEALLDRLADARKVSRPASTAGALTPAE